MEYLPFGAIYVTGWLLQYLEADPFRNWAQELAFNDYSPGLYAWQLMEAKELG
jgi:hypothetical protein